jgi:hypothetical protein
MSIKEDIDWYLKAVGPTGPFSYANGVLYAIDDLPGMTEVQRAYLQAARDAIFRAMNIEIEKTEKAAEAAQ